MTSAFPIKIRFRPECQADAESLFEIRGGGDRFVLTNPEPREGESALMHANGGMVWEIEVVSDGDMTDLVASMLEVPDGHRMLQTIDVSEHFTGVDYEGADERGQRIIALMLNATARVVEGYAAAVGCQPMPHRM